LACWLSGIFGGLLVSKISLVTGSLSVSFGCGVVVVVSQVLQWVGKVSERVIARMLALSSAKSMRGGGGARDGSVFMLVGGSSGLWCGR